MTDITMPRLSDAMEEGTILTWLKATGDHVDEGAELVEIETDKATMTYECPAAGVLQIVAQEGVSLPVGAVMARVGFVGAAGPKNSKRNGHEARNGTPEPAPAPAFAPAPASAPAPAVAGDGGDSIRVTPLARRLADAHNVDLATVDGTGPRGRIRRLDVARAAGVDSSPSPLPSAPRSERSEPSGTPGASIQPPVNRLSSDGSEGKGTVTVVEPTRLQQVVARRMAEAKATIPEFQVEAEVIVDAAIRLRAQLKEHGGERAPSFNDLIVKACALALREHPRANASYKNGRFELYGRVNIGVAVAAQDALVVPTVTDADTRSLGSIALATRRLVARVRSGEITPPELSGATFTVSNLGMYGMSAITPVINPPQAAILGVGDARRTATVADGALAERGVMTLRLTCDHRILYGADAAEFLSTVRSLLEQPLSLAL